MRQNAKITVRGSGAAYTARGVWEPVEGGWRLAYDEPAGHGLDGVATALTLSERRAVLTRAGAVRCELRFEVGAPQSAWYETPHGSFPAEVVTHALRVKPSARGALVEARYTLTLGGAADEHTLKILVRTEDET